MMNDSFETAYQREFFLERLSNVVPGAHRGNLRSPSRSAGISSLKAEKGLALQDIIQGIYDFAQTVEFSSATRVYFLDQIAQVEYVSPRFVLPRPL